MELQNFISEILQGEGRVVSFDNVALGPDKGATAGVLSALNFARLAFDVANERGPAFSEIVPFLCSMQMVENALAICHERPSNFHFEVEDVYHTPLFERSLKFVSEDCDSPNTNYIAKLLKNLRTFTTSAAIIITRRPLVITCLRLKTSAQDVFVLFNPRGASEEKRDASLMINASLPRIAEQICDLFSFDNQPSRGKHDRKAMSREKCAGHVFVPRGSSHDPRAGDESLILSSLTLLSLREELEELTRDNENLKGERQRLERSILGLEVQLEEEKAKAKRAWSSKPLKTDSSPSVVLKQGSRLNQSSHFSRERDNPVRSKDHIDPEMQFALELQAAFDAEHESLLKQKYDLMQTVQRQYHCGVCLDDFPEDDAVRIPACGHEICRDCAQGHVCAKIEEHRFPVLCPVCMADQKNKNPGAITGSLVQLLGVSEKQWEIWVEMEMAQFSIAVDCRKCHHSGFVDRDDLEAQSEIRCPFPACDHVWCKRCQQTIEAGGPKHSCDGTSELDHLMTQQGWRYCPSCKTPIQKTDGCNHLSCISPGCNTHFCYRCGGTINRTAIPGEILEGKTAHFRTCSLF